MVRLAISKGRILEEAVQMLSSINIQCKVNPLNSRKLIISTDYEDLEIIVIKATDVPLYIDSGKIDLGIVGMDTLMEDERNNHFRLHDMSISKCKLVVAGNSKSKYFFAIFGYFVATFMLLKYLVFVFPATTSLHFEMVMSHRRK